MNDVWNFMIYDAFGKLVAEYGGVSSPSVSAGPNISYIQQDWQGSVRTVSNSNGFIINRTDYSAFGESIGNGVGLRSTAQGYWGTTTTRRGYGLTEQDDATGLDHTWFRKNERAAGRWTSPDPYKGSMSLGDPQTFNRYSYVVNQPTNFVDPSGLMLIIIRCRVVGEARDGSAIYGDCTVDVILDDGGSRPVYEPIGGGGGGGGGGPQGPSQPPVDPPNKQNDDQRKFNECAAKANNDLRAATAVNLLLFEATSSITRGGALLGVFLGRHAASVATSNLFLALSGLVDAGRGLAGAGTGLEMARRVVNLQITAWRQRNATIEKCKNAFPGADHSRAFFAF